MDFLLCDTLEPKAVDFKKVQPKSMYGLDEQITE